MSERPTKESLDDSPPAVSITQILAKCITLATSVVLFCTSGRVPILKCIDLLLSSKRIPTFSSRRLFVYIFFSVSFFFCFCGNVGQINCWPNNVALYLF